MQKKKLDHQNCTKIQINLQVIQTKTNEQN